MTTPAMTWETARLIARPAAVADAQVVYDEYAQDPSVCKYMTWRPHRQLDETVDFLQRCELGWTCQSSFTWVLRLKEGGAFVGFLEIRVRDHSMDMGYALARRWWRQGLMSEALTFIVEWALAQPEIHRIWAVCDVENVASAAVLTRVGLQREGVLRRWLIHPNIATAPRDCLCFSMVRTG